MIRFLFRCLSTVALTIAVVMAVLDATRTVAASTLVMTPLGTSWAAASPATLEQTRAFVTQEVGAVLWDPMLVSILALPGFAVFGILSLALYAIGRKPAHRHGGFAVEA